MNSERLATRSSFFVSRGTYLAAEHTIRNWLREYYPQITEPLHGPNGGLMFKNVELFCEELHVI